MKKETTKEWAGTTRGELDELALHGILAGNRPGTGSSGGSGGLNPVQVGPSGTQP